LKGVNVDSSRTPIQVSKPEEQRGTTTLHLAGTVAKVCFVISVIKEKDIVM
jgi:hypothetical protein